MEEDLDMAGESLFIKLAEKVADKIFEELVGNRSLPHPLSPTLGGSEGKTEGEVTTVI
jgi:hypothetical protein